MDREYSGMAAGMIQCKPVLISYDPCIILKLFFRHCPACFPQIPCSRHFHPVFCGFSDLFQFLQRQHTDRLSVQSIFICSQTQAARHYPYCLECSHRRTGSKKQLPVHPFFLTGPETFLYCLSLVLWLHFSGVTGCFPHRTGRNSFIFPPYP